VRVVSVCVVLCESKKGTGRRGVWGEENNNGSPPPSWGTAVKPSGGGRCCVVFEFLYL
jgi:hypothetical protein